MKNFKISDNQLDRIEEKCRDMIELFNSIGLKTVFCCQGHNDKQEFYISFDYAVNNDMMKEFKKILEDNNINLNVTISKENRGIAGWEYHIGTGNYNKNIKLVNEDYKVLKEFCKENDIFIDGLDNITLSSNIYIQDTCGGLFNSMIIDNSFINYSCKNRDDSTQNKYGTYAIDWDKIENCKNHSCKRSERKDYVVLPYTDSVGNEFDNENIIILAGPKTLYQILLSIGLFMQFDPDDPETFLNDKNFNEYLGYVIFNIDEILHNYCDECQRKMKINFVKNCHQYYDDLNQFLMLNLSEIGDSKIELNGEVINSDRYVKIILKPTKKKNLITCNTTKMKFNGNFYPCENNIKFNIIDMDSLCNGGMCNYCDYEEACGEEMCKLEGKILTDMIEVKNITIDENNLYINKIKDLNDLKIYCGLSDENIKENKYFVVAYSEKDKLLKERNEYYENDKVGFGYFIVYIGKDDEINVEMLCGGENFAYSFGELPNLISENVNINELNNLLKND